MKQMVLRTKAEPVRYLDDTGQLTNVREQAVAYHFLGEALTALHVGRTFGKKAQCFRNLDIPRGEYLLGLDKRVAVALKPEYLYREKKDPDNEVLRTEALRESEMECFWQLLAELAPCQPLAFMPIPVWLRPLLKGMEVQSWGNPPMFLATLLCHGGTKPSQLLGRKVLKDLWTTSSINQVYRLTGPLARLIPECPEGFELVAVGLRGFMEEPLAKIR